jgi:hypothetical protein
MSSARVSHPAAAIRDTKNAQKKANARRMLFFPTPEVNFFETVLLLGFYQKKSSFLWDFCGLVQPFQQLVEIGAARDFRLHGVLDPFDRFPETGQRQKLQNVRCVSRAHFFVLVFRFVLRIRPGSTGRQRNGHRRFRSPLLLVRSHHFFVIFLSVREKKSHRKKTSAFFSRRDTCVSRNFFSRSYRQKKSDVFPIGKRNRFRGRKKDRRPSDPILAPGPPGRADERRSRRIVRKRRVPFPKKSRVCLFGRMSLCHEIHGGRIGKGDSEVRETVHLLPALVRLSGNQKQLAQFRLSGSAVSAKVGHRQSQQKQQMRRM